MRIIAILLTIISFYVSNAQPYRLDYVEYLDYNTIISDLKANGQKSKYFEQLDYESMLYLDKSCFKTLLKINPQFIKEKGIDTSTTFHKDNYHVIAEYYLKSDNIRDFFKNKTLFDKLQTQLKTEKDIKSDSIIYIKNNNIAIFRLNGELWGGIYKANLTNNYVYIKVLYSWELRY